MAVAPPPAHRGFHVIPSAMAEPIPWHRGGPASGGWAVQVGAFGNQSQAHAAAGEAKQRARDPLETGRPNVSSVRQSRGTLYRARLTGLSREAAVEACQKLTRSRTNCIVLSPDARSDQSEGPLQPVWPIKEGGGSPRALRQLGLPGRPATQHAHQETREIGGWRRDLTTRGHVIDYMRQRLRQHLSHGVGQGSRLPCPEESICVGVKTWSS